MKIYAATRLAKPLGYLHFGYLSAQQKRIEGIYSSMGTTVRDVNEAFAAQATQFSDAVDGFKTAFQHSLVALVVPAIMFPLALFYLSLTSWDRRKKAIVSTAAAVVVLFYYVLVLGLASNRLDRLPSAAEVRVAPPQVKASEDYDRSLGLP